VDEDSGRYLALAVSPGPELPLGSFSDVLTVHYHVQGHDYNFTVPVHGTVARRIVVSPSTVYFDRRSAVTEVLRTVLIRRIDGKPLVPIRKIAPPPFVSAEEIDPGLDAKPTRLVRLRCDAGGRANGVLEGPLRIWIEGEPEPLSVPCIALPKSSPGQ
jgi:hypothetical protein